MTKVTPEAGKERARAEDHHCDEGFDATTPGTDRARAPAVS
jgi:hypothetical protein